MLKFSVIVPIYNAENYLSQCLTSIIEQSLKDIEIILVNDGSTDNSVAIIHQFIQKDKRILFETQDNSGPGIARNVGLKIAQGKYIAFVDGDDYLALNCLEKLYHALEKKQADILCFGAFGVRNKEYTVRVASPELSQNSTQALISYLQYQHYATSCWTKAIRRDLLLKNKIVFENFLYAEDTLFCLWAFAYAKNIVSISEKLYYYRYTQDSTTLSRDLNTLLRKIKDGIGVCQKAEQILYSKGVLTQYQKNFTYFCLMMKRTLLLDATLFEKDVSKKKAMRNYIFENFGRVQKNFHMLMDFSKQPLTTEIILLERCPTLYKLLAVFMHYITFKKVFKEAFHMIQAK